MIAEKPERPFITMKIKVLKIEKDQNRYCHDCEHEPSAIIQGITKWDEIDEKDYWKLRDAIANANNNSAYGKRKGENTRYFIVQETEDYQEIFDSAKEFIEYNKKEQEKRDQIEAEEKKKREQKKIEREKKQLEKLKKKLKELEANKL